jgi:hypothetical protein
VRRYPGLLLALVLAAGAHAAEAPKPVSIDAATMRRLSVGTTPARAITQGASISGFARVLDPIPLAQLDSDIAAAIPAASASNAEAARSRALFDADATVSRKLAEAATTQARGDSAKLALLRRRLGLEWGPAVARLSDARRGALVAALAAGRSALVRIDSAGGSGQANLRTAILDLGDLGPVSATILGPARAADPRLQSPGLIAIVSGPKAGLFSTGLSVPAKINGVSRSGIFVPATAILRVGGATWAYVQNGATTFARRRLGGTIAAPGGLFAASGVSIGERLVTSGAAALYAAEHGGGPAE